MNVERINQLADDLDKVQVFNPDGFKMSAWGYGMLESLNAFDSMEAPTISTDDRIEQCGTAGCIAGWTALLYGEMRHTDEPSMFARLYSGAG